MGPESEILRNFPEFRPESTTKIGYGVTLLVTEWRNGGMAEWRNGLMAVWRDGGMAVWWYGGMSEWRNDRNGGTGERIAEWQKMDKK